MIVIPQNILIIKNRIIKNENRLNNALLSIKELEIALNNFKMNKDTIKSLNKYYGSKNWFKDKDSFEKGKISNVKAGVLSEDAIWNMNEDINDLLEEMKTIIEEYKEV